MPKPGLTEDQKRAVLFSKPRGDGQSLKRTINKMIDAKCGPNAVDALDVMIQVMNGTLVSRARAPNQGEDPQSYAAMVPLVHPSIQQRLDAAKEIFRQRNGQPSNGSSATLNVGSDGSVSASMPVDLANLSDEELEIFDLLRRSVAAKTINTIDVTPEEQDE